MVDNNNSNNSGKQQQQQHHQHLELQRQMHQWSPTIVFGGKRFQFVEIGTTENEMKDKVLDDVLKAPGEGNQKEQGQTALRDLSGLPRCISSKAYRDLIM